METPTDLMYAASGRVITALDRYTGRPVWRIKLPRMFGGSIVTVLVSGNEVFVGRGGYVYCLDRATGSVLWERGVGSNGSLVMMATDHMGTDEAAAQAAMAAQAAAAGGAAAAVAASTAAMAAAS
jgi:outer membrane protein assembly factor BamB